VRGIFATLACLIAVALGATAILLHSRPLDTIVFYVACVWLFANILISRAYTREYWKSLDKPISHILRETRSGTFPKTSALEQVTGFGGVVLMIVVMCLYFV
jgi:hypothetical protein